MTRNRRVVKADLGFIPGTIYVYYGESGKKQSIKMLRKINAPNKDIMEFKNKDSNADGLCVTEKTNSVIWVEDMFDFSVITHEVFHAVSSIFRTVGISLTEASEEAYAYAISHVVKQILRKTRVE